jgi:hypothetical protein
MLVGGLVVTFGTAGVIQGVAVAKTNTSSSEPFVATESARASVKPVSAKERVTSQFYGLRSSTNVSGL